MNLQYCTLECERGRAAGRGVNRQGMSIVACEIRVVSRPVGCMQVEFDCRSEVQTSPRERVAVAAEKHGPRAARAAACTEP